MYRAPVKLQLKTTASRRRHEAASHDLLYARLQRKIAKLTKAIERAQAAPLASQPPQARPIEIPQATTIICLDQRTPKDTGSFRFSDLPTELRLMIYEEYISDVPAGVLKFANETMQYCNTWKCPDSVWQGMRGMPKPVNPLALYRVSKDIHREMCGVLCERAHSFTANYNPMLAWSAGQMSPKLPMYSHLAANALNNRLAKRCTSITITNFDLQPQYFKLLAQALLQMAQDTTGCDDSLPKANLRLVDGRHVKLALMRTQEHSETKYEITLTRSSKATAKRITIELGPDWQGPPLSQKITGFLDDAAKGPD